MLTTKAQQPQHKTIKPGDQFPAPRAVIAEGCTWTSPELNNTQTRTSLARSVAILVQRVLASGFRV